VIVQGPGRQPGGQPAGFGGLDLDLEEALERGGQREPLRAGGVEDLVERVGGVVELEIAQVRAQVLVAAGLAGGHRTSPPTGVDAETPAVSRAATGTRAA
jgi:hypothetical protein